MVDKKTTNNMTYCNDKNCQNGACKYHKKLNSDTATGVNGNVTHKDSSGEVVFQLSNEEIKILKAFLEVIKNVKLNS